MSPRPYRLGKREEARDQGRRRILDAARDLLRTATAYPGFTVEAVARRADVARATVYYQFGSKSGLLEAICDDLAEAGGMADLALVFTNPAPDAAIHGFFRAFARFWMADRIVMRRLRALAALDPDVGAVIAARDQRRREGLTVLVSRLPARAGTPAEQTVRTLYALTSFETFDTLAGPDRDLADALPIVTMLADAASGVSGGSSALLRQAPLLVLAVVTRVGDHRRAVGGTQARERPGTPRPPARDQAARKNYSDYCLDLNT